MSTTPEAIASLTQAHNEAHQTLLNFSNGLDARVAAKETEVDNFIRGADARYLKVSDFEKIIAVPTAEDGSDLWVPVLCYSGMFTTPRLPNRKLRYAITNYMTSGELWFDSRSYVEFEFLYSGNVIQPHNYHRYVVVSQYDPHGGRYAAEIVRAIHPNNTSVEGVIIYLRSGRYRIYSMDGPIAKIAVSTEHNLGGTMYSARSYDDRQIAPNTHP